MKNIFYFLILIVPSILSNLSFAQINQQPTYAGLPSPDNILVVYNSNPNASYSDSIKTYYIQMRGIPNGTHVLGLDLPDTTNISGHFIKLWQDREIIRDTTQAWNDTTFGAGATIHAWVYFNQHIVQPLRNYLLTTPYNGQPLKDVIRYIVLCKGIPFRLQSRADWAFSDPAGAKHNVSVDALLSLLGNTYGTGNENAILNLFGCNQIDNPYYYVDSSFTMDYRFTPNHFENNNAKLYHLVTRLDGLTTNDIINSINRSSNPDTTGNSTWVLDADLLKLGYGDMRGTALKLKNLGFNVYDDYEPNKFLTHYNGNVIGYSSDGIHAGLPPSYIQDSLQFNYSNGAVFNTYESFNGNSLGSITRRKMPNPLHEQGLMTEFIKMNGTGGVCHSWEPGGLSGWSLIRDSIFYPAYAMGYNMVDAVYQGMPFLGWQNVVIGDPLTRIFPVYETETLLNNTTLENCVIRRKIIVPEGIILTLGKNVILEKNARIEAEGSLILTNNADVYLRHISSISVNTLQLAGNAYIELNNLSNVSIQEELLSGGNGITLKGHSVLQIPELYYSPSLGITLLDNSELKITGGLTITGMNELSLSNQSKISANRIYLTDNASINLSDSSSLEVYKFYCDPNTVVNSSNNANIKVKSTLKALGEVNKPVLFNLGDQLHYSGRDSLIASWCNFNGSGLDVEFTGDNIFNYSKNIFDHCCFNCFNSTAFLNIYYKNDQSPVKFSINNSSLFGINQTGIVANRISELEIKDCVLTGSGGILSKAISLDAVKLINLENCSVSNFNLALQIDNVKNGSGINPGGNLNISSCFFNSVNCGINGKTRLMALTLQNCVFNSNSGTNSSGINIQLDYNQSNVEILGNSFSGFNTSLNIIGGGQLNIKANHITITNNGIRLTGIGNSYVADNLLIGNSSDPEFGLFYTSTGGLIDNNTISGFLNGILLGNSSPKLALNTISSCSEHGLYVGAGSYPDLSQTFAGNENYPLSGFNDINTNGDVGDGSEIYFDGGNIALLKGCNTIADDRISSPPWYNNDILIDGYCSEGIDAGNNYWGNHPYYGNNPSGRFGEDISIVFEPYLETPCTYTESSNFLLLKNGIGNVIDTIYSTGIVNNNLTGAAQLYSLANSLFINNQYTEAKLKYQQITQNYGSNQISIDAYNKLYLIEKTKNGGTAEFEQLKNYYDSKLEQLTDTLMIDIVKHLSNYCLVATEEYVEAINEFDEIVQENPNTDKAFFAEIDAYTTALMMDSLTGGLGKTSRYAVNGIDDYNKKINDLLKRKNAGLYKSEINVLPTEYELFQNYPNPFNPETTIKYAIKELGLVTLKVYDILGNEVATIVNEIKTPGFYKAQFSAGNLASGVYFYTIITKTYSKTLKMVFLK